MKYLVFIVFMFIAFVVYMNVVYPDKCPYVSDKYAGYQKQICDANDMRYDRCNNRCVP